MQCSVAGRSGDRDRSAASDAPKKSERSCEEDAVAFDDRLVYFLLRSGGNKTAMM